MNKQQYETIVKWQDKTFTKATPISCVNHLQEEVEELKNDIEQGKKPFEEIADCYLLLFAVCNKSGMNYEDIVAAIDLKMQVNYESEWGDVNGKGYQKRIR